MKCLCVPKLTQLCTIHELTSWNHPRLAPRNLLIVFSFENLDPNRVLGLLSEDAYTRSRVYYTLSKRAGQQQREGRCSKTHEIGPTLTHIRSLWARAGARARAPAPTSHTHRARRTFYQRPAKRPFIGISRSDHDCHGEMDDSWNGGCISSLLLPHLAICVRISTSKRLQIFRRYCGSNHCNSKLT